MSTVKGIDAAAVGQSVTLRKTVTGEDVRRFAELSGDDNPHHTDLAFAARTRFGERIAHGALLIAYVSAAFTRYVESWLERSVPLVSYGYDRIRFIKPVRFGDEIAVEHTIAEIDAAEAKLFADVKITNQRGELVAVARHVMRFV
ncbi:MAG TPA: MaoC/PaaZ C-terminal domain-containing protein [Chloroflexota bacterium]|nr:MaoC/PaaZ C-terminal domain-containing protein [Chloroflexota bacterium]